MEFLIPYSILSITGLYYIKNREKELLEILEQHKKFKAEIFYKHYVRDYEKLLAKISLMGYLAKREHHNISKGVAYLNKLSPKNCALRKIDPHQLKEHIKHNNCYQYKNLKNSIVNNDNLKETKAKLNKNHVLISMDSHSFNSKSLLAEFMRKNFVDYIIRYITIDQVIHEKNKYKYSPLRKFIINNPPTDRNLYHVHYFVTDNGSSYNCVSPMNRFALDNIENISDCCDVRYSRRKIINHSLMYKLVKSQEFRSEYICTIYEMLLKESYFDYYRSKVLPLIRPQHNIILSTRFRKLLHDSLCLPIMFNFNRADRFDLLNQSPLRRFIQENAADIKEKYIVRKYKINIGSLRKSPLRNFIMTNKQLLTCARDQIYSNLTNSVNEKSLMKDFVLLNKKEIIKTAKLFSLKKQYRQFSEIPLLKLLPNHNTTISIEFKSQELAEKFLEDLNIKDFSQGADIHYDHETTKYNIYTIINDMRSQSCILNTFLSLREMCPDSNIKVTTLLDKVRYNKKLHGDMKQVATLKIIRRDQKKFTNRNYKKCLQAINKFNRKHTLLTFKTGFLDSWFSDTMVIEVECDTQVDKFRQKMSDLILELNMIKDLIFASLNVEAKWLEA
jgi:hypothetical protein